MLVETRKPHPPELSSLRPSDRAGAAALLLAVGVTSGGVALSLAPGTTVWIAGQLLLGAALVQWFVILHECGHETLFRTRRFHAPVGRLAGFLSLIPFACWTRIHGRHHKWTGWQDLDPTTEPLSQRERSRRERLIVNVCWKYWIPLFSVLYRFGNFWNLPRVLALFPRRADRRALAGAIVIQAAAYVVLAAAVGPIRLLQLSGLAVLVAFALEDLLLLSQHTHMPQRVSGGSPVRPYPAIEQEPFTRSLRLPAPVSAALLHFDAHELHHMYPFVPGYHLRRIPYRPENEIGWLRWVRRAKQLPGEVFLFQNRTETGWDI
jgi:fatty acid desaturase